MAYLKSSHDILKLTAPQAYRCIVELVDAGKTRKDIEELAPYNMRSLFGQVAEYLIEQKNQDSVKRIDVKET